MNQEKYIKMLGHTEPSIDNPLYKRFVKAFSYAMEKTKQELDQSVEGIEEATILEIIDHHNLGTIGTKVPINFRSMPVGCTSTIIYKMLPTETSP